MRLDFIACKYTHFIQYGKTIEYFFAKRITVLSFKTIPIILVILRKTIIFAHSDA